MISYFKIFIACILLIGPIPTQSWACTFLPDRATADTLTTIKVGNTYFQIPEKYLYTFFAVPAERSHVIILIPHRPSGSLVLKAGGTPECEPPGAVLLRADSLPTQSFPHRLAISDSVDFCGGNEDVYNELKGLASDVPPSSWARDVELANKFRLGMNPCRYDVPLSWDRNVTAANITEQDIADALEHENEQIRKAAEAFQDNKQRKK